MNDYLEMIKRKDYSTDKIIPAQSLIESVEERNLKAFITEFNTIVSRYKEALVAGEKFFHMFDHKITKKQHKLIREAGYTAMLSFNDGKECYSYEVSLNSDELAYEDLSMHAISELVDKHRDRLPEETNEEILSKFLETMYSGTGKKELVELVTKSISEVNEKKQ